MTKHESKCNQHRIGQLDEEVIEGVVNAALAGHSTAVHQELVRLTGLEPAQHCCRQDLNLLRLPISPQSPTLDDQHSM